ncbi:hypothetical protein DEO72_LG3g149 [Vigna unguiculata]|uniref:Uncharacterized protein n=1 Tax=Vigna unguiculata TaxID=3917 RepID=A0A4D6LB07_VIGUN|nr:hypothetical protein DEO72_LG3g149 [Vigna unguiculata]
MTPQPNITSTTGLRFSFPLDQVKFTDIFGVGTYANLRNISIQPSVEHQVETIQGGVWQ